MSIPVSAPTVERPAPTADAAGSALRAPKSVRARYPGEFLALLARDQLALYRRMAGEGDVVQLRLGRERLVFVSHPDAVKQVLVTEQRSFTKGRGTDRVKVLLGNGLLTNEGDSHLRQRRLVQPAFHRDRIAGYAATMAEYAERTARQWRNGETLDVHDEMMHLTRDIAGKTLFDLEVGEDPGGVDEAVDLSLKMYRVSVLPFGQVTEYLPIPFTRRVHAARARLNRWLMDTIAQRRREGTDRGDLLSMLIASQDTDGPGGGMSDQQLRDEMVTLFVAGHETTAVALSWTWYLLSQHPVIVAKLHAELAAVLGGRVPTGADVPRLAYTRMVFSEAMRIYPPAWLLERRAARDIEIGGYLISAGSLVYTSPYMVHHDARWYPDPERFDPERWQPEVAAERHRFAYAPFGAGTRICIGEQFAWMEGILLLATIAQRWRLIHDPSHTVATEALVTLRPKYGMRMRLEAR